ncbi:hypothetical protein ACFQL1_11950 [Halomicroarcula sp. GCM10025709]|uniref:hypothetical protein n=1 Tax=Halomicroarcula sp. GCM10025709 TaxID=3252669 RepID=UPI0036214FEB
MAQYVRLAHAVDAGEPVETPAVVAERFGTERDRPSLTVGEFPTTTEDSPLPVEVITDAAELLVRSKDETRRFEPDGERLTVEVPSRAATTPSPSSPPTTPGRSSTLRWRSNGGPSPTAGSRDRTRLSGCQRRVTELSPKARRPC